MSEVKTHYGSVVLSAREVAACKALPEPLLLDLARGPQDKSITFAARQELGSRIVSEMVAECVIPEPLSTDSNQIYGCEVCPLGGARGKLLLLCREAPGQC